MADGERPEPVEGIVLPPLQTDVVLQPSPFVAPRHIHVGFGSTIEDIVRSAGIAPALAPHVQVFIGDELIEPGVWHLVRPKAGAVVNVRVQLHGGGGGSKDIMRTIAMIAVIVVVGMVAGPIAGAIGAQIMGAVGATGLTASLIASATLAVTQVALATAGMLLVNALIPPPGTKNQWGFDQELGNPYGQITGLRNQMAPYGPIPRVLGKRRMFPMLAGRPYTETQGNDQYLRLLLLVGQGPLKISDIKLGETSITAYPGIEIETREGWDNDAPVTLYQKAIKEDNYAVVLDAAGSTTTKTTRTNTKEISIEIGFPSGVNRVDKGELRYHEVSFTVQYRVAGSGGAWINAAWLEPNSAYGTGTNGILFVRDKTQAGLRRSGRWTVSPGQYEVKVTRTTAIEPMGEVGYAIFTTLRSIVDEDFLPVDGMSLIALRMKASGQLNGVPDQINCVVESYLPVYNSGNATWAYQITRNPAWAYADLLRRRGTETINADSRLDLPTISSWATACDSTPANGAAPYWTFDGVLEGGSIFTALRTVASHGRASFTVKDGKYSVVRDVLQTVPVQHISPRNSWGYSGSKVFAEIPHALRIRFSNEDKLYAEDEVVVYHPGYSADGAGATDPAETFETLDMPGISRSSQAWREGMYHFAVLQLRTETHTVSMDVENLRCTLGSLVQFSHDAIKVGLAHGRVKSVVTSGANITQIVLDGEVQCDPGELLGVRCRKADFATAALPVTNPATSVPVMTNTLTLVTPIAIASGPAVEDLFQFGIRGLETAPMIVKRIAPGPDLTAVVSMSNAQEGIWTADQGTIPAFNSYITTPRPFERAQPPLPVMRLDSDSNTARYTADSTIIERISVAFQAWPSAEIPIEAVEIQYRDLESPNFTPLPRQPRDTAGCYIEPVNAGAEYEVRARTISPYGLTSEWVTAQIEAAGKTTAPDPVTSLTASNGVGAQVGTITLNWGLPTDIDLWATEIWVATTNNRALAAKVDSIADPGITYDHALAGTVNRYYWARTVDLSGNISTWFPVSATAGVLGQTRAVVVTDLDTTAPGTPGTPSMSQTSVINTDGSTVTNMTANWSDNAESDLNGYLVEWLEGGASLGRYPVAISQDTIRVKGGVSYEARVWAIDRLGNISASYSTGTLTSAGDTTPPGVITSPTITGQLGTIYVSWTNPTDDDFSHVKIYRHTSNVSGSSTFVGSVLADSADLYVPIANTTYYFWAATVDRTGNEGAKTSLGSAQALPVGDLAYDDTVPWGDVGNRPTHLTDSRITTALDASGILQTNITEARANASSLLQRATGGIYTGDLTATAGATWGTNIGSRPTHLTDSRITTALDASGILQTNITEARANASSLLQRATGGIYTGDLTATAGATWGTNIGSRPANLAALSGSEGINNASVSISAAGALSGAGGGTVTIGGLGYTGDLAATAGATWGTNIGSRPANLAALSGSEGINNAAVSISAAGALSGAGGGTVTIGGLGYTGDLAATAGATWGTNIGSRPANLAALSGSEGINNAAVSISAAGALSGAGGGTVTIGGLGYTGDLAATAGATWGTNIGSRPANLAALSGSEGINNAAVSISAAGALSGAGGGTVTIGGLGYTGDLAATAGATWGTNIGSRPANLAALSGSEGINNAAVSISAAGALSGAGGGTVTIGGLGYTGDLAATAGATWGTNIGSRPANLAALSGSEGINNAAVSISAAGALSGAGGGTVTIGGLGYTGDLAATAGATWGTNIGSRPANLAALSGSEGINNAAVSISAAGALSGAGGGTVTIGGLGYTGHLQATRNTGALADLNTVGSDQITDGAVGTNELGSSAVSNIKLANDCVGTTKVLANSVTPVYAALTTGIVSWSSQSTEKDLQTVASVVVTRGKVIIRASFTCRLDGYASVGVNGIMRLYRDGSEIYAAQTVLIYQGTVGGSYLFPRQWFLDYIDEPGAGTFTYKITFDPGHTADGDCDRRFLSVSPLHG